MRTAPHHRASPSASGRAPAHLSRHRVAGRPEVAIGSHWSPCSPAAEVVCNACQRTHATGYFPASRSNPSQLTEPTLQPNYDFTSWPVLQRREASGQVLHRSLCMNVRVSVSRRGLLFTRRDPGFVEACQSLTRTRPDHDSRHHFAGAAQSHGEAALNRLMY